MPDGGSFSFLYKECGHVDHKSDRVDYRIAFFAFRTSKVDPTMDPPRLKCYQCSYLAAEGKELPKAPEPLPTLLEFFIKRKQEMEAQRAAWALVSEDRPRTVGRIFFTKEMKEATLNGRKKATTRDHQKALGCYEACTGHWRYPASVKPFALIRITSNAQSTWQHSLDNWKAEGFESLDAMLKFVAKHEAIGGYAKAAQVFYHEFEVVRLLP